MIREEEEKDFKEVEILTREAFYNMYQRGADEHYIVHVARKSEAFVKELSLVYEKEGRLISHIMFTRAKIELEDGKFLSVLCLGPLSVLPEYQRKGIGSQIIKHSLLKAKEEGFEAVFLYGNPDFYVKSGFVPAEKFGIATHKGDFDNHLLVYELQEDFLKGGKFFYDEVYLQEDDEIEAFDELFPKKEKRSPFYDFNIAE